MNMDLTTIIEIVAVIAVIYLFVKFVVSPIIRIILGIVIILVMVYILQRFFGFDMYKTFGPWAKYLDINNLGLNLNWIFSPINYYIDQAKNILNIIWQNMPKQ